MSNPSNTKTLPIREKHARKRAEAALTVSVTRPTGDALLDALQLWDRQLQNLFKGITTRGQRHASMKRTGR